MKNLSGTGDGHWQEHPCRHAYVHSIATASCDLRTAWHAPQWWLPRNVYRSSSMPLPEIEIKLTCMRALMVLIESG
jgi:hypothetical protein